MAHRDNPDGKRWARRAADGESARFDFIDGYVKGLLDSTRLRDTTNTFVRPRLVADSDEGKPLNLAEALEKSRRVVLLGDVGAGKTTLLLATAFDYATFWSGSGRDDLSSHLLRNDKRLPVYVSLRPASATTIDQQISTSLSEALGREIGGAEVADLLQSKKLLILFDQFSQIPSERQLETLHAVVQFTTIDHPHQSFIIALRSQDFPVLEAWFKDTPVLTIQPLDDREITSLVSQLLEDRAASVLLQKLSADGDWWEMARNPLFLATACSIVVSGPSIDGDIAFLRQLITALIARTVAARATETNATEPSFGDITYFSALAQLAFAMLLRNSTSLERSECEGLIGAALDHPSAAAHAREGIAAQGGDVTAILAQSLDPELVQQASQVCRDLIDSGILQQISDGRAIAFRYSLLKQFFGAMAMSSPQAAEAILKGLGTNTAFDGDREKSIAFYILQSQDRRRAIADLFGDGRSYARILLAAKCLTLLGDTAYRELVGVHPADVDLHEQFGRAFRQLRAYRQARQALEDAVKLDPNRATAHQELADLLTEQGDFEEAMKEYQAALRMSDNHVSYRMAVANVSARRGLLAEARAHIEAAAEALAQTEAELHHRKGHLAEQEEDFESALVEFQTALQKRESSHLWFHVGSLYRRRGEFAEAETALQRAISRQFGDADAHREIGILLEERGDVAEALEEYKVAARLQRDAETCVALGRVYRKLGRLAQAEAELQRATALDPSLGDAAAELGLVYEKQGKHQEALPYYRQAVRIVASVAEYRSRLGWLLKKLGNAPEAETELAMAVKLAPSSAEYRDQLGSVLADSGRYREALEHYEKAATLRPEDPTYLLHIGVMHSCLGKHDAAVKTLSETLRLCSTGQTEDQQLSLRLSTVAAGAHDELGLLHERTEQWQEALRHYRAAASLAPLDKVHPLREGLLLKNLGQLAEAAEALRRAASLDARDPEIRAELGGVCETAGDQSAALAQYEAALEMEPNSGRHVVNLARVRRRLSQFHEASKVLADAMERGLDSADLRREMAAVCIAMNDPDAALLHSRKATAGEPENPWSHIVLAQSLLHLGQIDDALQELKTALALDPGIAEAYYRLAQIHVQAGSLSEALTCAAQATALAPDESQYAFLVGHLYAQAGQIDDAIDHLIRATDNPRTPAAWHAELGELYESRGNLEKALVAYQRAAEEAEWAVANGTVQDAAYEPARYVLRAANVLFALQWYLDAAEMLLRAITLDPNQADAHATLGKVLLRVRQPTAAHARLLKACELSPRTADYWSSLASTYLVLDNSPEAVKAFRRALELNPENASWHNGIGKTLGRLGQWDDALANLERAANLAPGAAEYAHDVALGHARVGNYKEARKSLERALSLENKDRWRQELAGILTILGEPGAALAEYRAICSRNSSDWRCRRQLGVLCLQSGLEDESLETLEAASNLAPADTVDVATRYALGLAYAEMGRYEESLEQQQLVLQRAPGSVAAQTAIGAVHRGKLARIGRITTGNDEYRLALESFTHALTLDPEFAPAYSELGQLLELSGDLASALDRHLKAVALQPDSSTCRCRAAALLVKMERLDEAQALVQEGLLNDGSAVLLLNQLGLILEARANEDREHGTREERQQALQAFESALKLAPWRAVCYFNAGRVCLGLGDPLTARSYIEEAVRLKPRTSTWRRQLGLLHEQAEYWHRAIQEYERVLESEPDDAESLLGLGRNLAQVGRLDDAAAQLQRALKVEPSAAVYDQFAIVRQLQGQLREAVRFSQQALKREPGNHAYQLNLALTLKALGQTQKASEEIRRIASEAPKFAQVHYHLGADLEENGELSEAAREYLRAMAIAPMRIPYARAAARVHRLLGHVDEAQTILKKLWLAAPRDPETMVEMARVEQARGNFDAAFRLYRRAIAVEDRPEFRSGLAAAMRQKGLLDDALTEIRVAIAAEPRNPRWQNDLALILEEQGALDEAIKLYREALRLDPNGAEFHRNLGVALKKKGKFDEAIVELQRALDLKPDYVDAYRHLTAASASQLLRRTLKSGG